MKIIAIRIQNLASLEGTTEIDFSSEPLRSAGIFAITGPTGSGKSTILDALCLALYAKTPRYRLAENGIDIHDVAGSTMKQDDVRGILRDGTGQGFAEVDFAGVDGQQYRANWSVRRARNKPNGNLQAYELTLKNLTTGQDIPGRKTEILSEITRLIGLTFEQFTRSVLLAQGDFTAFLKAGKDEKSSLLEKLTGTSVYSVISKKIFEHHRDEQQKLRDLHLLHAGIATLTTEERTGLTTKKTEALAVIKRTEQQLADLNKELAWHGEQQKLETAMLAAEAKYNQAKAKAQAAQPRQEKLQQIGRVQPVRVLMNTMQSIATEIASKTAAEHAIINTLQHLSDEKKAADTAKLQADQALNSRLQEEENARPLLDKAKSLDVLLAENSQQTMQAKDDADKAVQRENEIKKTLAAARAASDAAKAEVARLTEWITAHETKRPVAEQETLILSKLDDATTLLNNLQHYSNRIAESEETTRRLQQEKQQLAADRAQLLEVRQQVRDEYDQISDKLHQVSITELEHTKASLDESVPHLIAALGHWQLYDHTTTEYADDAQQFVNSKSQLQETIRLLEEAERSLETKKSAAESSGKMLAKAKLAAAQSVTDIRAQLEPEEPCPVCGSTEHPYAAGHPSVHQVLTELETEHRHCEAAYHSQLTTCSGLRHQRDTLNATIDQLTEKMAAAGEKLKELEREWMEFGIAGDANRQPATRRTAWLKDKLQSEKERQARANQALHAYRQRKEQLDRCQDRLTLLDRQLTELENGVKDQERIVASLKEQHQSDQAAQQQVRQNMDLLAKSMAGYFASEKWLENWQSAPDAFVASVQNFARDWKAHTSRREDQTRAMERLAEKCQGLEQQLGDAHGDAAEKLQKHKQLSARRQTLTAQRKEIFAHAAVSDVEMKLKQAVHAAKVAVDNRKAATEKVQHEITRARAQHLHLQNDLTELAQKKAKLNAEIAAWISEHNKQHGTTLTETDVLALLTYPPDWIENERSELQLTEIALLKAQSALDEHTKAYTAHRRQCPSARPREDAQAAHTQLADQLKQQLQDVHEIDFTLRQDQQRRDRIGSLQSKIEKQAAALENWAKLNELIGSADGKKFRQVAQKYTLDLLLDYANAHLEVLSKRYILQRIPDSLGLQVIDRDMGDETRTVYALSGGESFLVSLALALGLASLSSSRMKVESLFIDEGFGSLDPTTLHIAMDALERLHHQGRKVGVISHVQEMTERIPVQIAVSKQHSGKSKVRIIGFAS